MRGLSGIGRYFGRGAPLRSSRSAAVWLRWVLTVCTLLGPELGHAVLIASGDGTENTEPPIGFDGWDYVGKLNGLSGVYVGSGWVLTANHVGPGDFELGGNTYPWVPGSQSRLENTDGTLADLLMFSVFPYPTELGHIPLRETPPNPGDFVVMIGYGKDRGDPVTFDPNGASFPPPAISGWTWGPGSSKRWGTNSVEGIPSSKILGTVAFYTSFDDGQIFPEAQNTQGDSGGGLFIVTGTGTELAGILYAVGPSPGQPVATSLFTNLSFAGRIDFYFEQIETRRALPEPGNALSWGLAFLLLVVNQKRRCRPGLRSGRGCGRTKRRLVVAQKHHLAGRYPPE